MSLELKVPDSLDVYRWAILGGTLTRFLVQAITGQRFLSEFNYYNNDAYCISTADGCIDSKLRLFKDRLLEQWALPNDIFNLWLALAPGSLVTARTIMAPIITVGMFLGNFAFFCFFFWSEVTSGRLFEIIPQILFNFTKIFEAGRITEKIDEYKHYFSFYTILVTQIPAMLYVFEANTGDDLITDVLF